MAKRPVYLTRADCVPKTEDGDCYTKDD